MSAKQKSQRGFVAVTLITILAIALVLVVYATLLGTFPGGEVTIVAVKGKVWYSTDNSTFTNATLSNYPISDPWYVCFVTETGGYTGDVQVVWDLVNKTSEATIHSVTSNNFPLNGSIVQYIYATSDGSGPGGNYNWGLNTTVAGTYYIKVTISTYT